MKKIIIYGVLTIGALAFIMWKLNANKAANIEKTDFVKESNNGVIPVLVEKVAKVEFDRNFTANGNFEPIRELTFSSEVSGRITQLLVKEGSVVSKGQLLVRVDDELLNTELQQAKVNLDKITLDKQRNEKAFETGGVTQKQLDDSKTEYKLAQARLDAAQRRVNDTYVKAPISGVINAKYVELGTYLSPGNKMFDIVDVSKLKLVVSVPEAQVIHLDKGDQVKITTNVFPETSYTGVITFIASKGDNTLNYPVEMVVDNVSGKTLKAGMYGSANFEMPQMQPAIIISRNAFVGGVKSNQVFVMEKGIAKLKKVVAGNIYGDRVEIREGLNEGDTVITSGQINLVDGSKVSLQTAEAK
ncbi:efflux transporter periplasmic adaptor subunit [Chitinophaga caeni]|uniref:Efflux transporter periplasmic adaptor subunit n=1 Tax=Chitinophaga caeni TaxID=2029983 RepID=A0A291QRJ4_9BACT|nr:efflux RND transporter periplasmic adaptor subunit [Chitinophaga caeni]ATL46531.1 efflux transporter periplasmic adaptor subunit [Chitinophaga caeni]